jgi:hypothetical protein
LTLREDFPFPNSALSSGLRTRAIVLLLSHVDPVGSSWSHSYVQGETHRAPSGIPPVSLGNCKTPEGPAGCKHLLLRDPKTVELQNNGIVTENRLRVLFLLLGTKGGGVDFGCFQILEYLHIHNEMSLKWD